MVNETFTRLFRTSKVKAPKLNNFLFFSDLDFFLFLFGVSEWENTG